MNIFLETPLLTWMHQYLLEKTTIHLETYLENLNRARLRLSCAFPTPQVTNFVTDMLFISLYMLKILCK